MPPVPTGFTLVGAPPAQASGDLPPVPPGFTLVGGPSKPEPSLLEKVGEVGGNVMNLAGGLMGGPLEGPNGSFVQNPVLTGMGKGIGETAHTIGRAINAATGDSISWLPNSFKQPGSTDAANASEEFGKMSESVAEFALGDEALKGMSILEKLGIAQKITDFAKESPTMAKLLNLGLNAIRSGTAGALEGTAKEGPEGAASGAAMGVGGEIAGAAINKVGEAVLPQVFKQVAKGADISQPEVQEALRTVSGGEKGSLREVLSEPIAKADTEKRSLYQAYDEAAGVDRKALEERLENTQDQMSKMTGTPADARRLDRLQEAESSLKQAIATADQRAEAAGIKIGDADAANIRLRALQDAEKNVFKNQSVIEGNTEQGEKEHVNVDNAITAIQKMMDNEKFGGPRWDQAFGNGSAQRVLSQLRQARAAGQKAVQIQQFAKWIGVTAGAGAVLGGIGAARKAIGSVE